MDLLDLMQLGADALVMARKGTDFQTMRAHFECVLERKLEAEEGEVIAEAWRQAAPERAERERRRSQAAADQARRR